MQKMTISLSIALLCAVLAGCSGPAVLPTATIPPTAEQPTPTVILATATPDVPTAAVVNGEGIPQSFYEGELKRFQSAGGVVSAGSTAEQTVIQDLIDQVLLAQGAAAKGYSVDDTALSDHINQLSQKLGTQAKLDNWINAQGYTQDEFRYAMRLSMASAWMRDQITSEVPTTAEQAHVRQIFFTDRVEADSILSQVRSGADFATLAEQYDPVTRGDIGWFPRGYLTQPQVEEAAFALQVGAVSEVISSDIGYHILQLIESDPQHALSPDALSVMQRAALKAWLEDQKNSSQIEIHVQ